MGGGGGDSSLECDNQQWNVKAQNRVLQKRKRLCCQVCRNALNYYCTVLYIVTSPKTPPKVQINDFGTDDSVSRRHPNRAQPRKIGDHLGIPPQTLKNHEEKM